MWVGIACIDSNGVDGCMVLIYGVYVYIRRLSLGFLSGPWDCFLLFGRIYVNTTSMMMNGKESCMCSSSSALSSRISDTLVLLMRDSVGRGPVFIIASGDRHVRNGLP